MIFRMIPVRCDGRLVSEAGVEVELPDAEEFTPVTVERDELRRKLGEAEQRIKAQEQRIASLAAQWHAAQTEPAEDATRVTVGGEAKVEPEATTSELGANVTMRITDGRTVGFALRGGPPHYLVIVDPTTAEVVDRLVRERDGARRNLGFQEVRIEQLQKEATARSASYAASVDDLASKLNARDKHDAELTRMLDEAQQRIEDQQGTIARLSTERHEALARAEAAEEEIAALLNPTTARALDYLVSSEANLRVKLAHAGSQLRRIRELMAELDREPSP